MQYFTWSNIVIGHTCNGLLPFTIIGNQLSERFITNGCCICVWMQGRTLKSNMRQIAFHCFFAFIFLFMFTTFNLFQWGLGIKEMPASNNLSNLTEEKG